MGWALPLANSPQATVRLCMRHPSISMQQPFIEDYWMNCNAVEARHQTPYFFPLPTSILTLVDGHAKTTTQLARRKETPPPLSLPHLLSHQPFWQRFVRTLAEPPFVQPNWAVSQEKRRWLDVP